MNYFVYIDSYILVIVMIAVSLISSKHYNKTGNESEQIFMKLIFTNGLILCADMLIIILLGRKGIVVHYLLYLLEFLGFFLSTYFSILWVYYCWKRVINVDFSKALRKYVLPIPLIVMALLMLFTAENGGIFYITHDNQYARGPFFNIFPISIYFYIALALLIVLRNRKQLLPGELIQYIIMPIIPIILGVIQMLYLLEVLLVWPITAVMLLGIKMNVLDNQSFKDFLTGLHNRRALDAFLKHTIIEHYQKNKLLGIIMIDIDSFKKVNDNYGHLEGDRVLIHVVKIIRKCCAERGFIARYGGDEFVIVLPECSEKKMDEIIEEMNAEVKRFNEEMKKSYLFDFSIGKNIVYPRETNNAEEILHEVDQLMYEDKNSKKYKNV